MSVCDWGKDDCKFMGTDKCDICFTDSQNYKPAAKKKNYKLAKRQNKADKRGGSNFEFKNHNTNSEVLSDKAVTGMTLNSGATVLEKGDEQIHGIINIMEELKTKLVQKSRGTKSFTIHKEWLDKLRREAIAENMEFWYLKFCFLEGDKDVYCITEQDIIMSMVKTMVEDRKKAKLAIKKIALANARAERLSAEIKALKAKINEYKLAKDLMRFMHKEEG